jgi:hypothetical protein
MSAPYRSAPERRSAASFDGRTLTLPLGASFPKVCLGCGEAKVKRAVRSHEAVPAGLGVTVMFLSTLVGMRLWVTGSVTLRYALCAPCRQRTMNADHARQALAIASLVVAIGFATAAFNGGFLAALAIGVLGPTLIYATNRRFVRDRQLVVVETTPHLRLRGVHPSAAESVLEKLRVPDSNA